MWKYQWLMLSDQSECLSDRKQSYRHRMWVLLLKKKKKIYQSSYRIFFSRNWKPQAKSISCDWDDAQYRSRSTSDLTTATKFFWSHACSYWATTPYKYDSKSAGSVWQSSTQLRQCVGSCQFVIDGSYTTKWQVRRRGPRGGVWFRSSIRQALSGFCYRHDCNNDLSSNYSSYELISLHIVVDCLRGI